MYCSNCGKEFDIKNKIIRYCTECKELRNNKKDKDMCICGVELSGNSRKYCTECAKAVKLSQIQKVMSKKHHIAINKDIYNDFQKYFKKPAKEIERLMLSRIEEVCKH